MGNKVLKEIDQHLCVNLTLWHFSWKQVWNVLLTVETAYQTVVIPSLYKYWLSDLFYCSFLVFYPFENSFWALAMQIAWQNWKGSEEQANVVEGKNNKLNLLQWRNYALINKCMSVQREFWEWSVFQFECVQPGLSHVSGTCIGETLLGLITFSNSSLLFLLFLPFNDKQAHLLFLC